MTPLKIFRERKSLEKATEVIIQIFQEYSPSPNIIEEWNQWKEWFEIQKQKFILGKTALPTYFVQIKRVQQFMLDKTPLTVNELFEMDTDEKEKHSAAQSLKTTPRPQKLIAEELEQFLLIIYNQLSKDPSSQKLNPKIKSLINNNISVVDV